MRNSAVLKIAGGVLALSSLLFAIPSQAGAEGGGGGHGGGHGGDEGGTGGADGGTVGVSIPGFYSAHGYFYNTDEAPLKGAVLIHVKIRNGHKHTLEFKSFTSNGSVVDDHTVKEDWGYSVWYDPSKVSSVQVTLSDRPPITSKVDGDHCYYEDHHGYLQPATDRPCNAQ
jgi:hypothetical protein